MISTLVIFAYWRDDMKILNFKNDDTVIITGSSRRGYINTTYADLVHTFGDPTYTTDDKVTAEWTLEFLIEYNDAPGSVMREVVIATIYDWKQQTTPHEPYDWHIGGYGYNLAIECVYQALNDNGFT